MFLPVEIFILLFASIGSILVGLFTLLKNPQSATNRLFVIFSWSVSLYLITNFISLHVTNPTEVLTWINTTMICVTIMNFLFFLLVTTFPKTKQTIPRNMLFLGGGMTLILTLLFRFNFVFTSVKIEGSNIQPQPGAGMILFVAHMAVFLFGGFIVLFLKYFQAKGIERVQRFIFLLGTIIMYGATFLTNFVLVVLFKTSIFVGLLPLYALIFVGCISYAIVRHKFLDINLLVGRAVSFLFLILTVALIYALGILFIGTFIFHFEFSLLQQVVLVLLTVIIVVSFQTIRDRVEKSTDRFFFKGRYNTNEEIGKLTKIMASTLGLKELVDKLLEGLKPSLKYTKASCVVFSQDGAVEVQSANIVVEEADLLKLKNLNTLTVFNELEEGEEKSLLRKLGISIVSPLRTKEELVGLFLFGEKESGESYSEQDMDFIRILSDEVAVALQNARSYEEIKRFNETLQQKIDVATNELKEANVQLQELDKLKDEFVSLASHELRTPMAAIKGSLSTILEGYAGTISEQTREFLTAAYNENDRLIRLVNNLLNTSRIEAGKLAFNIGRIDITTVITEVVRNLQPAAKEKNIYLTFDPAGLIPHVLADEDKVKEVIINLIGNAIKFTSTGGISIHSKLDGDFVLTSVADTGTGIHKEHYELLFKKFSQLKTDYTKTIGGTGLGLYISKKIIEGLGGKIWLESEVGKGTTFYFTVPIAK